MTDDGPRVLAVPAEGAPIGDEAAALDVIGDAFGADAQVVSVPVERLSPDFFRLRSGVAGAVTAKFANYRLRLVVVGDPSRHGATSGPVDDWMREANRGRDLWFVADDAELERRLAAESRPRPSRTRRPARRSSGAPGRSGCGRRPPRRR